MAHDVAYLQHGKGTTGPFRTESVPLRHECLDSWSVRFEGRWRKVHIQINRLYVVYRGERITVQIFGV